MSFKFLILRMKFGFLKMNSRASLKYLRSLIIVKIITKNEEDPNLRQVQFHLLIQTSTVNLNNPITFTASDRRFEGVKFTSGRSGFIYSSKLRRRQKAKEFEANNRINHISHLKSRALDEDLLDYYTNNYVSNDENNLKNNYSIKKKGSYSKPEPDAKHDVTGAPGSGIKGNRNYTVYAKNDPTITITKKNSRRKKSLNTINYTMETSKHDTTETDKRDTSITLIPSRSNTGKNSIRSNLGEKKPRPSKHFDNQIPLPSNYIYNIERTNSSGSTLKPSPTPPVPALSSNNYLQPKEIQRGHQMKTVSNESLYENLARKSSTSSATVVNSWTTIPIDSSIAPPQDFSNDYSEDMIDWSKTSYRISIPLDKPDSDRNFGSVYYDAFSEFKDDFSEISNKKETQILLEKFGSKPNTNSAATQSINLKNFENNSEYLNLSRESNIFEKNLYRARYE
ncbi:hypothetical protein C1645_863896 [Glomus cerebriforme]|uniref:Uncharacterized protein n=1 Tax=Glomus cerebriforme TaxID=658196 RepID=A0A397SAY0_9GLOM|nr:hypothetical protein C1645_863896 [Glomus cerebriforme]